MDLESIGEEKTALFIIISDTDDTFNFIVSILYSQLFNLLCDLADKRYHGRLPVHVRCLLDEFANIGQIPGFEKLIPKEAAGSAIVYAIVNGAKMHGTGTLISDALVAMDYPFPKPETVVRQEKHYLDGFELTMVLCAMGHGWDA